MLDFLFKDKNGEIQTLNDLIILNTTKLQLAWNDSECNRKVGDSVNWQ